MDDGQPTDQKMMGDLTNQILVADQLNSFLLDGRFDFFAGEQIGYALAVGGNIFVPDMMHSTQFFIVDSRMINEPVCFSRFEFAEHGQEAFYFFFRCSGRTTIPYPLNAM